MQTTKQTALATSKAVDILLLTLLSTLWGASYTFIRVGVESIPPVTLIAARTLIAGLLLFGWMSVSGVAMPRTWAVWKRLFVQASLNSVIPFTLIAWAEQYVEAGVATILNSTAPVFVFFVTWFLTKHEAVTTRKLVGVIAGLLGICLIIGFSAFNGLGDQVLPQLAIVAATVCYAGAAIYGRSFQGVSPLVPAAGSLIAGAIVLIPISLIFDRPWALQPSFNSTAALLMLSVFSTAIAFVIYFRLVQTLGSVGTTSQAYLRVPIGVAIGVIFLGESLSPTIWMGLGCVVIGVAAMTIPARSKRS
jgi:drug/metabolite transporter (DMT)-like permease